MKKASTWLLVIGWVFAVLGGLIGIGIGAYLTFAKTTGAEGETTFKYDDSTRKQSVPMLVIALLFFSIGVWLRIKATR
jgi:hypothetical protein